MLAVSAASRRKVRGQALGTSRTGSIIFIEPEATVRLSREMAAAQEEEKEEILRILRALSDEIRPYAELLTASQKLLTEMDLLQAKAHYALEIGACLPALDKRAGSTCAKPTTPSCCCRTKPKGYPPFHRTSS